MNKGDIIEYNSDFDFDKLPRGSIVKVIAQYTPDDTENFIDHILVKSLNNLEHSGYNIAFININTGGLWAKNALNKYSFEIIRYGPK